ncbi:DUF389 domain-containing protein [Salegentibacter sp. F188]|uniref:DUF389 domain-containing protein n=1 Tax=Autumnicola patrickiae TaxID=3075591 RepID=A0ABU3E5B8_9FLAO|nr:DUF389 domain-containing protein [Salegentibacter sp. F188]MDT0691193.1 DUF389 domain-containing protein [Salegentibacter sp. F188]
MRQLTLKIPKGHKEKVQDAIDHFGGKNTIDISSENEDVFMIYLPNEKVNDFLKKIDQFEEPEITLIPRGVITLYPPASEAPDQVADVKPKSSLEIYLGGIQSVGSMFGLIGYSFVAGIIVWIGLFTTTAYLLVAAMLVAPFAGPAMNAALATASGKADLLKSSLKRYAIAIITGIFASFLLTLLFPLTTLTPLMEEVSQVSKFALFLPLVSGFAGAINICQSERDSLVSGAAVGILVAASLAPPVGLIGAGLYMMDWQVVFSSLFRILLQLLGIHLAATLVFYFYGKVTPDGVRFLKGVKKTGLITTMVVILGIGAMMYWQFRQPPFLSKASMNTELAEVLDSELKKIPNIRILNKDVTFNNIQIDNRSIATFEATILKTDTLISSQELEDGIIRHLKQNMEYPYDNVYEVFQIKIVRD